MMVYHVCLSYLAGMISDYLVNATNRYFDFIRGGMFVL